jgi:hypothetical protein
MSDVIPIDSITRNGDVFRCVPLDINMYASTCVIRQSLAKRKPKLHPECLNCPDGQRVRERLSPKPPEQPVTSPEREECEPVETVTTESLPPKPNGLKICKADGCHNPVSPGNKRTDPKYLGLCKTHRNRARWRANAAAKAEGKTVPRKAKAKPPRAAKAKRLVRVTSVTSQPKPQELMVPAGQILALKALLGQAYPHVVQHDTQLAAVIADVVLGK